jgi:hypothetical protein
MRGRDPRILANAATGIAEEHYFVEENYATSLY